MSDQKIHCPECKMVVHACSDFDNWFFLCAKCGWESHRFDKGFSPDRVTQEEVERV